MTAPSSDTSIAGTSAGSSSSFQSGDSANNSTSSTAAFEKLPLCLQDFHVQRKRNSTESQRRGPASFNPFIVPPAFRSCIRQRKAKQSMLGELTAEPSKESRRGRIQRRLSLKREMLKQHNARRGKTDQRQVLDLLKLAVQEVRAIRSDHQSHLGPVVRLAAKQASDAPPAEQKLSFLRRRNAVVRIQAAYRGHACRQNYFQMRQQQLQQDVEEEDLIHQLPDAEEEEELRDKPGKGQAGTTVSVPSRGRQFRLERQPSEITMSEFGDSSHCQSFNYTSSNHTGSNYTDVGLTSSTTDSYGASLHSLHPMDMLSPRGTFPPGTLPEGCDVDEDVVDTDGDDLAISNHADDLEQSSSSLPSWPKPESKEQSQKAYSSSFSGILPGGESNDSPVQRPRRHHSPDPKSGEERLESKESCCEEKASQPPCSRTREKAASFSNLPTSRWVHASTVSPNRGASCESFFRSTSGEDAGVPLVPRRKPSRHCNEKRPSCSPQIPQRKSSVDQDTTPRKDAGMRRPPLALTSRSDSPMVIPMRKTSASTPPPIEARKRFNERLDAAMEAQKCSGRRTSRRSGSESSLTSASSSPNQPIRKESLHKSDVLDKSQNLEPDNIKEERKIPQDDATLPPPPPSNQEPWPICRTIDGNVCCYDSPIIDVHRKGHSAVPVANIDQSTTHTTSATSCSTLTRSTECDLETVTTIGTDKWPSGSSQPGEICQTVQEEEELQDEANLESSAPSSSFEQAKDTQQHDADQSAKSTSTTIRDHSPRSVEELWAVRLQRARDRREAVMQEGAGLEALHRTAAAANL